MKINKTLRKTAKNKSKTNMDVVGGGRDSVKALKRAVCTGPSMPNL
jgi:hypothetical protein